MRRSAVVVVVAIAALVLPTAVGLGAEPFASDPDGMYSRFGADRGGGVLLVERLDDDSARLTVAVTDLVPAARFRLFIGAASCAEPFGPRTRIFSRWLTADAEGGAFFAEVVPWLWLQDPVGRSVRLMEEEGIFYFCRAAHPFRIVTADEPGLQTATVQYARVVGGGREGLVLLDRLDGTTARITVALSGLTARERYRSVASAKGCDDPVTPSDGLFTVTFRADQHGRVFASSQDIEVENDETHWVRSSRIRLIGGDRWACPRGWVAVVHID